MRNVESRNFLTLFSVVPDGTFNLRVPLSYPGLASGATIFHPCGINNGICVYFSPDWRPGLPYYRSSGAQTPLTINQ